MGTRADFYVGKEEQAEWLGSIAWDGYPDGISRGLLEATNEAGYREEVSRFLAERDDCTLPEQGWPWPWEDSGTTDYAYTFDEGRVQASRFGNAWFDAMGQEPVELTPEEEESGEWEGVPRRDPNAPDAVFPNMGGRQNVARGLRSGLIMIRVSDKGVDIE